MNATDVLEVLHALYPDAQTELAYQTPFQLLVATVLSAQTTDVRVNSTTPELFFHYPDAQAMAQAPVEHIEQLIQSIGFHRTKSRYIVALAQRLVEHHDGHVPKNFEQLTKLQGVGRKTANVVMANAFGRPAIAVDTHVGRLARRLGLSVHTNPDKIEADLETFFPQPQWIFVHNALILHGRRVCKSQNPRYPDCALGFLCPQNGVKLNPVNTKS